jgi:hypothetical protein
MTERRRFSRIIYRAPALITRDGQSIPTTVQDLSLHGVLLSAIDEVEFQQGEEVEVEFPLPESEIVIHLSAHVVEVKGTSIRVKINHIDINSIAHLRRLVELNVGDDSLLHRELEHLTDLGDDQDDDDC